MIEAALRDRRLSTLTPEAVWRAISGRGGRVLAVRCLGIAALFGFEVALARSLGVTGYGAFSFGLALAGLARSEEHTSALQSLMRISYAVFCLQKKQTQYCTYST